MKTISRIFLGMAILLGSIMVYGFFYAQGLDLLSFLPLAPTNWGSVWFGLAALVALAIGFKLAD